MKRNLSILLGLITLCATSVPASQEQLASSVREARLEAGRTADQLRATLDTLNALTTQKEGDLRAAYDAFAASVPKTEASRAWTATYLRWMANDGEKYFREWQQTIDGITNESLRRKAQKRLAGVRKSYDQVAVSLTTAGEKFDPFLADLRDIQKALENDVTSGGVKAVKRTVSQANWNYQGVNRAIGNALKEMDKMQRLLAPQAK